MTDILKTIETQGIFPVIEIEDIAGALPLAEALRAGGLNALEITLRTDVALEAIRTIRKGFPDMLVGAGTVLTPSQVGEAICAGASFMVAPGFNPRVVSHCLSEDVLILPGVDNATGVELAIEMGLSAVKFFPAQARGGINGLKSLANPFKNRMKFIPLGGICPGNLEDYARFQQVLAVGGTWIANQELLAWSDFNTIRRNASEAVGHLHGFAISRILFKENGAGNLAEALSALFPLTSVDFPALQTRNALTAGAGDIEILCNSVERASLRLAADGITSDGKSAVYHHGVLKSICLESVLAGFTVKLILRED